VAFVVEAEPLDHGKMKTVGSTLGTVSGEAAWRDTFGFVKTMREMLGVVEAKILRDAFHRIAAREPDFCLKKAQAGQCLHWRFPCGLAIAVGERRWAGMDVPGQVDEVYALAQMRLPIGGSMRLIHEF
jgi:hypothetical protein